MHACLGLCCSQVSDLISKIQTAYVETLEELGWMDSPSKEKAREKVKDEWLSREDEDAGSLLQFLLTLMHLT